MENPFLRRAAEFLRDTEAFLAIVSPEPARAFLSKYGHSAQLYDRLVILRGTPGSGKTTLARLFDYATLTTLLRNRNIATYAALLATLNECQAIVDNTPTVLACRLPLESDYRVIWEFPYSEELKLRLTAALIQARAVLGWTRSIRQSGQLISEVNIVPRADAVAATAAMGGTRVVDLFERAKVVEAAIYKLVGALIPPPLDQMDKLFAEAYHPFDVIQQFTLPSFVGGNTPTTLRPLAILDDAHVLHPAQFSLVQRWLARRETRVARWVLSRIDVMHAREAFAAFAGVGPEEELPGITSARETIEIMLQSEGKERGEHRTRFRRMARDMADRYLKQMPVFSTRKLESLGELLDTEAESLPPSRMTKLAGEVDSAQRKLKVTQTRRTAILAEIDSYRPHGRKASEDLRLAMLGILMHRYAKRIPQTGLFNGQGDPEPSKPLKVDSSVYDASRLHLFHRFDRPYYHGIEDLCDAGSENAEQFLHLAAALVEASATRLIRARSASLDARAQHQLLREKADEIMRQWSYPQCELVARMVERIAGICKQTSLLPNAWIGAGANAYGVAQEEFDALPQTYPELARTIQFGLAYNALLLVPRYECKNRDWCLLELGGVPILKYGLTLRRGGFIEGTLAGLKELAGL